MKKALVAALLIIAAAPFLIVAASLPPHGDLSTPVQTGASAFYLKHGAEQTGAENIVTGVILNYRGLDTNGEVTVIFTGFAAAFAVLLPASMSRARVPSHAPVPVSPVVSFAVRLLAPFTALFTIYVILNGHLTPGGGFQGGAILGGLFIVLATALEPGRMAAAIPDRLGPWLRAAAPLAFSAMGVLGLVTTGYYLGFPMAEPLHAVRALMLLVIEIGIGLGGAAIFAALFVEMEAQ